MPEPKTTQQPMPASLRRTKGTDQSAGRKPANGAAATAVIYARIASRAPQDSPAIDRQLAACRQRVKELDAEILHEFVDCGVSGATLDRPGLQSLLRYLTTHHIDYVVVTNGARISRRFEQHKLVIEQLQTLRAELVTVAAEQSDDALDGWTFIPARYFPVVGYQLNQPRKSIAARIIRFQIGHRVIQGVANDLVQRLRLRVGQGRGAELFQRIAQKHRNKQHMLLPSGESEEFTGRHSRSSISRRRPDTKHSQPTKPATERRAHAGSGGSP